MADEDITRGALEAKIQRLQLSEELERALDLEFGRQAEPMDPLMSSKFDINDYINGLFPDEESLGNLDTQINSFDDQLVDLDLEIKSCIREQAYASENAREELRKINEESAELVDRIESVKGKAEMSEQMVKSICSEIRCLDYAKRNITFTITSLKRMIMLLTGIEQLRGFCIKKQYREAANLIEATEELCQYFKDYRSIPQIHDLNKERDHLCNELRILIFEDFNKIDKGQLPDLLYDACFVIDALGEQAVNEVRNWFCNFILEPYRKLFTPGQPDASFDNTKRRFAWLRRTLKDFQDRYESIFPSEWNLKPMIAYEFCRQTKLHLDDMLSRQHQSPLDVSVIIDVLQTTIDFEMDLHARFIQASKQHRELDANELAEHAQVSVDRLGKVKIDVGSKNEIMDKYKGEMEERKEPHKVYERIRGKTKMSAHIYRFKGCISECFEPYLKSYSESEERKIIEAIEQFMQADKIETTDYLVFSSSLHLFKNIKGSLKRCISFSTSKALFDLHVSFKNVFRHYCKLLKKHLPQKLGTESDKIQLTEEIEAKACIIINTCEYCLDTIPGLHTQIYDKIDEQYREKVDLNVAQDNFRELINQCITAIVSSVDSKCDQQYQQGMQKINWASFSGVQDTSAYFKSVSQLVQKRVIAIKSNLHQVYMTYLLNKLAAAIPSQYLAQVYKIKKLNEESSQQFQLDLVEMKSFLLALPLLHPADSVSLPPPSKVPDSYASFVSKNVQKLESRFKVLGYPLEQLRDAYTTLVKDGSQEDFELILTIRGVKKAEMPQYKII